MNIDIIICYKSLLKLKGLIYNIGSYTIFALFFFSIICSIVFCAKGYNSFIKNIKSLIKKKLSLKKRTKEKKFKSNKNKMKNKSRFSPNHFPDNNNINNNNILTINNVNINVNMKKTNSKKKKNKKIIERKPTFNDYELNSFEYDEALKYDNRSFFEYYKSLIKTKQIIIFTFFVKSDYNSSQIKIILFLLSFSFFYAINALFFTDSTMHQIYIDHGIYDIFYQLPQI